MFQHGYAQVPDRQLRLLIVEDVEDDALLLIRHLERQGYRVQHRRVDSVATLSHALDDGVWDAVLSDYALPGFSGMEALTLIGERFPDLPCILVSGVLGEDAAVQAMKHGARDYLLKSNLGRLGFALERACRDSEAHKQLRAVEQRHADQLRQLAEAALVFNRGQDLNTILGSLADQARGITGARCAVASIFWNGTGPQVLYAVSEHSQFRVRATELLGLLPAWLQDTFFNHALSVRYGRQDLDHIPWPAALPAGVDRPQYSWMGTSLTGRDGRSVGCVQVLDRRDAEFDEQDQTVLMQLAQHAAVAIENVLLLQKTRESETRYRVIAESASDAIITADEQGRIHAANPAVERLFGYTQADLLGQSLTLLVPERHRANHHEGVHPFLEAQQWTAGIHAIESEGLHRAGHEVPIEVSFAEYELDGRRLITGFIRDVSERRRAQMELTHQALHDALTDLPNRSLFQDRLQHAIFTARRQHGPLTVLVLDLDRFKGVNDIFGHHAGDLLLQLVARRLHELVRESDTVARLGGDEFALVLPGTSVDNAEQVAAKIVAAIARPFLIGRNLIEIGTSVGISRFPEHADSVELLIRHADVAMYQAKRGGTGYAVYEPVEHGTGGLGVHLTADLRSAISGGDVTVHFQPKVHVASGRLLGTEALARWHHPEHGPISPDTFVPLAEASGLIRPLTQHVLDAALHQSRLWHDAGMPPCVAVNLSSRSLNDATLPTIVEQLLAETQAEPSWLTVEVTENQLMSDPEQAMETLSHLQALGVEVAVDDFGTGYSSLAYLRQLHGQEIKIDRSFVRDMDTNSDSDFMVRSAIDLGHNLGMRVVAEGVESRAIMDRLAVLGCDVAQGYAVAEPLTPEAYQQWFQATVAG